MDQEKIELETGQGRSVIINCEPGSQVEVLIENTIHNHFYGNSKEGDDAKQVVIPNKGVS